MTNSQQSNYRWHVLTLAAATNIFAVAVPFSCMPVLFKEISNDLGLSLVQIGTIWGIGPLAGTFTSLVGGMIIDRYGTKRTLSVACLLAGIVGALRGLSGDFTSLAVTAFFFGFLFVSIALGAHKIARECFPGRRLAVANGVLSAGIGVGFALGSMISATVLSPLLGGWRNVLFLYGGISVIISILWFVSRSAAGQIETGTSTDTVPFRQALSRVVHVRSVWLIALIRLCFWGCHYGVNGYLPLYLRGIGWTAAGADGALAALTTAATVAVIPLTLLYSRLGSKRVLLLSAVLMTIIGVGLLSIVDGALVWPLVILVGIFREGLIAILITMVMEVKEVGVVYAATALGLTQSLGNLGAFISPPLGNSLASINPSLPFVFWAALAVVALLVVFRFTKDK